jgi:Aspartyl protease
VRVGFRPLPGAQDVTPRPVIDVRIQGLPRFGLGCLIDTGSLHNRFGAWVADSAGIDRSGTPAESLGVGGRPTIARTVAVTLAIGEFMWEAPVSFCDPWPWDFQLLGQEGFFRWFRVVIEAADRTLEITTTG